MNENLTTEQAVRVLAEMGITRAETGKILLLVEIFLETRIDLPHRETLTVSFRGGRFTIQGGKMREVESLDEQALQKQAQVIELFPEEPPEDSWEPSPPEALRVFQEYDDLTGEWDE
jgi:hypothetical protein